MSELCLGTVQLGMKYGINNAIRRQPTLEESLDILDYAIQNGITVIDTARAYGDAELVLGEYIKEKGLRAGLKIISKLRPNVIEMNDKDISGKIKKEIEDSLGRIGVSKLDGYLLHTPEYIHNPEIVTGMVKIKEEGYTDNIGVSIYDLKDGYAAIETGIVDYIQLPYSILDQRGIKEGFISKAKKEGIKIFTRSAFLQGLFMMDEDKIPNNLKAAIPYLKQMNKILMKYGVDKVSAIMGFVKYEKDIDYLVFGVEKKEQLIEDIDKYSNIEIIKECIEEFKKQIGNIEKAVIFPSLWSNGKKAE